MTKTPSKFNETGTKILLCSCAKQFWDEEYFSCFYAQYKDKAKIA